MSSRQKTPRISDTRKLADKLDNAFQTYAHEQGDGFSDHDFLGAYEYREEGYALAEQAFNRADRDDFIEAGVEAFDESARYLIACAAAYRLAELGEHRVYGAAA